MAEIVQFRPAARAREEAALWLARLDKGLDPSDRAALRDWLAADSVNGTALTELARVWDQLDVLRDLAGVVPLERPVSAHGRRWRFGVAAAAAAAALVGTAVIVRDGARPPSPGVAALRAQNVDEHFETLIGGLATEQLPDGSVLRLNTDTEVTVAYADDSRELYLRRGEAHFEVAPNPLRPFNVHVGERVLQAVGTAFNVHLRPDGEIELTVTEGKVKVAGAAGRRAREAAAGGAFDATVVEGEYAILERAVLRTPEPRISRLEPGAMDIKLAWQRGMLIFEGEPLQQILSEFARYTTTQLVLEGDQLRNVRVGGYFRAGDIDGLLAALRDNFQIEHERVGEDRIVLRPARAVR
jgi:transmembrane sensor